MRRLIVLASVALLIACAVAANATDSPVIPESCTFTNLRGEGVSYLSNVEFYRGYSLQFTNCVLYSGTSTSTVPQGLTNVAVVLSIGSAAASNTYTGTVNTAVAPNVWNLTLTTFPTNWEAPNMQVKITDANTNSYVYPWKLIHTKAAM